MKYTLLQSSSMEKRKKQISKMFLHQRPYMIDFKSKAIFHIKNQGFIKYGKIILNINKIESELRKIEDVINPKNINIVMVTSDLSMRLEHYNKIERNFNTEQIQVHIKPTLKSKNKLDIQWIEIVKSNTDIS